MSLLRRTDDHQWSQQHLSHYAEGDLPARARRRLDRHAADCVDCGRGIRAMRALLRLIPAVEDGETVRAPAGIFDRIRGTETPGGDGAPAAPAGA
ncbi:MAG TPA: zf-HC2 domain-containing protein [Streptosporangiaceae bacterium]|jgi:anti-sigma factor RsiW